FIIVTIQYHNQQAPRPPSITPKKTYNKKLITIPASITFLPTKEVILARADKWRATQRYALTAPSPVGMAPVTKSPRLHLLLPRPQFDSVQVKRNIPTATSAPQINNEKKKPITGISMPYKDPSQVAAPLLKIVSAKYG